MLIIVSQIDNDVTRDQIPIAREGQMCPVSIKEWTRGRGKVTPAYLSQIIQEFSLNDKPLRTRLLPSYEAVLQEFIVLCQFAVYDVRPIQSNAQWDRSRNLHDVISLKAIFAFYPQEKYVIIVFMVAIAFLATYHTR